MISFINKIFWKVISSVILALLIIAIWQWAIEAWTVDQVLDYLIEILKYGIPSTLFLYFIYKLFIEKIVLWFNRKKSAQVIAEVLPKVCQVSGAVRSGKDSSTIGASMIVKEHVLKKEKKELANLENDLYIYDFEKIKSWLDINGKKYFVASDHRINNVFTDMIRENECFIADYWIRKGINYKDHFRSWKYRRQNYVPDYAYQDGITPGGIHFLDLLKKYTILYIYHNFIPNFVMSNQPILESFTIVKKTGRIKKLFSKKLSQDFFKLKEDTPIPFPKRGFVIETETAILYSNTDKKTENENKDENGIREFYTTSGHILREEVFIYGITQSPTRTSKFLRELYPGYQHVFKMKFKATSGFKRFIIRIRILFKKIKKLRLYVSHLILCKTLRRDVLTKQHSRRTYRIKKKISRLSQKEVKVFNKGYIIFYKGVYDELGDVKRKVKFPIFGVIQESKTNATTYTSYGFKQTNKITDCFGKYDTFFMYTVREIKEIIRNEHFVNVPNWESFKVSFEDINYMNYITFIAMTNIAIKELEKEEKSRKKHLTKLKQDRKSLELPNLIILEDKELFNLMKDYGISEKGVDLSSKTYRADIIKMLAVEYKSFNRKEHK